MAGQIASLPKNNKLVNLDLMNDLETLQLNFSLKQNSLTLYIILKN